MIQMLKNAEEMNRVASEVRNARITKAKAKAEAEAYVHEVVAPAIEKRANDGAYHMIHFMGKADVSVATVADILTDAGYDVKRSMEILAITW